MSRQQDYFSTTKLNKLSRNALVSTPLLLGVLLTISLHLLVGCASGVKVADYAGYENIQEHSAKEDGVANLQEQQAQLETAGSATEKFSERARDEELQRLIRQRETKLFDRLYEKYAGLYNEMINQYMMAQSHFQNGDLEQAKITAKRAAKMMPSELIYEFVMVILVLLEDNVGLDEWSARLQELREVKANGGLVDAEGKIIMPQ